MQTSKAPRPPAIQATLALGGFLVLAAAYLVSMRLSLGMSELHQKTDADTRDAAYLAIHGGLLLAAAVIGFGIGSWLRGLGLAYAMLLFVLISLLMIGTQLGSYELACAGGHNGIIRHWSC